MGEVRILAALDGGDVEVALAIALTRIDDRAVVAKGDIALGCGGIGDALGGGVVRRGDEDLTADHECDLLAVRGDGGGGDAGAECDLLLGLLDVIAEDAHLHALRLTAGTEGVDLAVIPVAEGAVGSRGEEADRVVGVGGKLLDILTIDGGGEDVEAALRATLTEEVERLAVSREDRVTILTLPGDDGGVLLTLEVIPDDISSDGGGVVLAPLILHPLIVLIDQSGSVGEEYTVSKRRRHHHLRTTALGGDAVELVVSSGEDGTGRRILDMGCVEDVLAVETPGDGLLTGTVSGDTLRLTATGVHDVDVLSAVGAGADEGDLRAVRTPHRSVVIPL